jgi:hypothetical protein
MGYIAFVLDEESKQRLLEKHPAKHPRVLAHHVTLKFGVTEEALDSVKKEFEDFKFVTVRGYACDETTDCIGVITDTGYGEQGNGTPLHITISVAEGYSPVQAGKTVRLVSEACGTWVLRGEIQYLK